MMIYDFIDIHMNTSDITKDFQKMDLISGKQMYDSELQSANDGVLRSKLMNLWRSVSEGLRLP